MLLSIKNGSLTNKNIKMNRRDLIRMGIASTALGIIDAKSFAKTAFNQNLKKGEISPTIISTWNHGLQANKTAWEIIEKDGFSIDAVESGVKVTESDINNRSVGIGGYPDKDGHVTLDACIMDHESNCGSVAFLEGIAHPISVARAVMEKTPHVMLVGKGAKKFALTHRFKKISTPIPIVKKEWKEWKKKNKGALKQPRVNNENHDTIGLLALDKHGNISGSCTTSGWAYKMHGRVGDSPIIGAGLFVDNEIGGACATGVGESIIRIAGSHTVVECMRHGYTPQQACEEAISRIIKKQKNIEGIQCCFIAIDKNGNVGSHSILNGFNYALKNNHFEGLVASSHSL